MRNFPRLASIQVLCFGYSRDMLEYPRRDGCDHPRRYGCDHPRREKCGCFSKGKQANTLLWPVIAQFVAGSKGYKVEGQTGVTGTYPTQCHHNGEVLSI
jgi:hypothetical protein